MSLPVFTAAPGASALAETLRKQAVEESQALSVAQGKLAKTLHVVEQQQLWRSLGYRSFLGYVSDLGRDPEEGLRLVEVYRSLMRAGISLEEAIQCGWSKIELIESRLSQDPADELLEVVTSHSYQELKKYVRYIESLRPDTGDEEPAPEETAAGETSSAGSVSQETTLSGAGDAPAPRQRRKKQQKSKVPVLDLPKMPRASWGSRTDDFLPSLLFITPPMYRALDLAEQITGSTSRQSNMDYICQCYLYSCQNYSKTTAAAADSKQLPLLDLTPPPLSEFLTRFSPAVSVWHAPKLNIPPRYPENQGTETDRTRAGPAETPSSAESSSLARPP